MSKERKKKWKLLARETQLLKSYGDYDEQVNLVTLKEMTRIMRKAMMKCVFSKCIDYV